MWVFPKIGVGSPNHPCLIEVFHYKPSILGVLLFLETPMYSFLNGSKIYIYIQLVKTENPQIFMAIVLMVQKSCDHQLRLVVYPIIYDASSLFSPSMALFRFLSSRPPLMPSKKSSCKAVIGRLATWKVSSTSHLNPTKLLQTFTPGPSSSPFAFPACELSVWLLRTSMLSRPLYVKNSYVSHCLRLWTFFTLKFWLSCASMLPAARVAHKTYSHSILVRLPGFSTIPGGWPWDFWTINSI